MTTLLFNVGIEDVQSNETPYTSEEIPDGIYYIVLTDLVGSTNYTMKMGNDAGIARSREFERSAKLALKHALSASTNNSGRFVKKIGDAVLLVFSHFPDIVQWHLNFDGVLQLASLKTEPIQARTWIHVGELRFEEGDVNGSSVNYLFKAEKNAKKNAEPGKLIATNLAREIAEAAVFPKHCVLESWRSVSLGGHSRLKLFKVSADLPFLFSKQQRDRLRNRDAIQ